MRSFKLCFDAHLRTQDNVNVNSQEVEFLSDKLSMLMFLRNRVTKWRHVAPGLHPQIKRWNKTFHGIGVASEYPSLMIPLRLRPRNLQHFETKTIGYLTSLVPYEVFLKFTLYYSHPPKLVCVCPISNPIWPSPARSQNGDIWWWK